MADEKGHERGGLMYGVAAYGLWGLMPFYFIAVGVVPSLEILAHRIVWSAVLLGVLLTVVRRWPVLLGGLRAVRTRRLLLVSSVLIGSNWFLYIWSVESGQVIQSSLGYFINPLVNVLLGLVFFGERLRVGQWAAVALATGGLLYLAQAVGAVPWLALALAVSFGFYGLVRKVTPLDALTGLAAETFVLGPVALGCLIVWAITGRLGYRGGNDLVNVLLLLSGVVTTVPLLCFGHAARRLPLSVLGFLQYLSPSVQFVIGVAFLKERFTWEQGVGFGVIWAALALLTAESVLRSRLRSTANGRGQPISPLPSPQGSLCTKKEGMA